MVILLQWRDVMCPCHLQVALPDTEVDLFGQQVLEQSLASGDTVTKAIYFVVLIFCAPFWEEVSAGANALAVQWLTAVWLLPAAYSVSWVLVGSTLVLLPKNCRNKLLQHIPLKRPCHL